MTLRTPRRRISPRAKRRYRLIRDFFRRALGDRPHSRYTPQTRPGSSSQHIKINSSIAVNVTNLKHKIVGIEHQLHEVSKHCQDLSQLEASFRKETQHLLSADSKHELESTIPSRDDNASHYSNTKLIYKPENRYRKSEESDYASNYNYTSSEERRSNRSAINLTEDNPSEQFKYKKKNSKLGNRTQPSPEHDPILQKHRTQSMLENVLTATPSSSYHSLARGRATLPRVEATRDRTGERRHQPRHRDYSRIELIDDVDKKPKKLKSKSPGRFFEDKHAKSHKKKGEPSKLDKVDQEFIEDLIKKQYKAVKLLGRKHSEASQFSVPVCRDQEFLLREEIQEGPELCSCCMEADSPHCVHAQGPYDTRPYNQRRARSRHRTRHLDPYNDSAYYDVVPVKEKSSPKSRRKFVENEIVNEYYREVPPSPRTLKPRLNLKAQHLVDYEDHMFTKYMNKVSGGYKMPQEYFDSFESDVTSEVVLNKRAREKARMLKPAKIQTSGPMHQDSATVCSLQEQATEHGMEQHVLNVTANDCTLNKTQDTDISDKTDKALCEIKDILQNFLQEIKKDAVLPQPEQSDNEKQSLSTVPENNGAPNSLHASINSYSAVAAAATAAACALPTGFVPQFPSPCCYPVLPMCPVNCMQNGYVVPSRSFTCQSCANNTTRDTSCQECAKHKKDTGKNNNSEKNNETDELIKEIYKYISKNPKTTPTSREEKKTIEEKVLTSRSVGSARLTKRYNARVGTSAMKCYSKSCEAIGSRVCGPDVYTSVTQSDTILEKLSLEANTNSDTELSGTDFTVAKPTRKSKIANVLKSIVFLKKKKKDTETSETTSSIDLDMMSKRAPFRQDYIVNRAECYPRGHSPRGHSPRGHSPRGRSPRGHSLRYSPRMDSAYGGYGPGPSEYTGYDGLHDPSRSNTYGRMEDPRSPMAYDRMRDPCSSAYTRMDEHHGGSPYGRMDDRMQYGPHYPSPSSSPYPNPYDPQYNRDSPNPPLCLKEVEVRSTGTQSEKKTKSFFQSLRRKASPSPKTERREMPQMMPPQMMPPQPMQSPMLPQPLGKKSKKKNNVPTPPPPEEPPRPSLFSNWKKFQEKVQKDMQNDTMMFGLKQQQKLADGDKKVKNAVIKKLFMKKNPFSPNNLIIKALMGTDVPPSFEPPPGQMKLVSGAKLFLR